MMQLVNCAVYLMLTGALSFVLGRFIPKKWFHADRFPYKAFAFEKEGKIYTKLKIQHWQNKVPDMSKIFPKWMPAKNMTENFKGRLPLMIQETCAAELTHWVLCFTGLGCLWISPGIWGAVFTLGNILLGNLPFVMIQRYNRPRLVRLEKKQTQRKAKTPQPV